MLDLFLANSRRGWGSSETAVAVLTPFSQSKSLCYRLKEGRGGGLNFMQRALLCSYASCRVCQERAGTLKERNKWQRSNMFVDGLNLKAHLSICKKPLLFLSLN